MDLKQRAKVGYERGRLWLALVWLVPVAVWTLVCWQLHAAVWPAPLLAALVVGLKYIGLGWGRGVGLGLLAGVMAGLYPLLLACSTTCSPSCALQCMGFGAVAALLFVRRLPVASAVGSLVVCAGTSAMACLAMGMVGLWGALAVVTVGSGLQVGSHWKQSRA